ncbi:chitin-binding domain-containing protein [Marivita hallyeonensis]|uniref:Chitin binding Peritrophin-A domain-containing protein n=1 Tax=Marivita hallyeonensis TaxID=996342 RepID=A0A1M5VKY8_9RHOB|nr:chitin-binding domain-containing protein [Marivita hallyeonensis]SHH75936.1 Chitin binding Peritrophin-A domain-containing protein [Marivita hallyeonensis]
MTIKTLLTTAALTLATATSGFAACQWGDHDTASMTCAAGTVYDAETNTCKVVSG